MTSEVECKQPDRSQDLREYVNSQIAIRLFEEQDTEQIAQLFHNTVREINIRDYSSNQVRAWAPDNIYFRNWVEVCSSRFTYIAHIMDTIVGFGELEANGHIDCFYCHKNYQGCGIGKQG
ncbi:GNAT family N-acetyltransferase [Brunnivagina elsteri]|uniref:N-acetyltransferase domain-containing protein n=1 Tax=Brunnivagina elsteri CCALA 953 TaxID=987040 RepID=A0A2A2TGB6_9CYAN|nr:GNAT family N-acetyltransferase [Calothrix elsteri]PAX52772.1 hypothetical protein CK510_17550 [Calothrix elsteri CCALA 953]